MKRSYSDLEQHTGDPPFTFGPSVRGSRQPKQYQQQTEPGTGKIKACMQCGTTRTPQWREGPYGPKTLCNACGVKRVRAIKAQQQGKNPGQVPHSGGAGSKKKASAAAARTESMELATTLQLLAGNMEAGPPPAKRQARAAPTGGRGRRATSLTAVANHAPEYDPFDPAAAAALSAPPLGSAVQKALAAMAAKGSLGGESNPTDSGEEISWSPADHQQTGDAGAAAAAAAEGTANRRQRQQQQQQLRAAMAAAAAAQLQSVAAAAAAEHEELLQLPTLPGAQLEAAHLEAGLCEGGYDTAPMTDAGQEGKQAVDEEAAAVANLLSMSAAADQQQPSTGGSRPSSSAGKSAMRELVAALTAGNTTMPTISSRSPARRQSTRTPPPRHVVTVHKRGAAAAAAAAAAGGVLLEEDVMYLLGPGMTVMARHVAPDKLLEVIKLNELASEAQRHRAACEAAVEAVEQILRDKQQAAMAAQAAAHAAMQRLHSFVGELNAEHGLMMKAVQEQQPTNLASRLPGGRVESMTHLDLLAASLQQHQQLQPVMDPQEQQLMMDAQGEDGSLADLAAAAAAAAHHAGLPMDLAKAEADGLPAEGCMPGVAGHDAATGDVDAASVAAGGAVDAAEVGVGVDAGWDASAVQSEPVVELPPQPQASGAGLKHEQPAPALGGVSAAARLPEAAVMAAAAVPAAEELEAQAAQLLGSFQELAAIAGLGDVPGADNNGVAAAASPTVA